MRPTRYCRVCGAAFEASPADTTVNCPEHRGRKTAVTRLRQPELCGCGKTVFTDSFGSPCSEDCPQCGERAA